MLGIGYYLKIEKINSKQENQSVLIAKICSRKIQKNRKSAKKNAHKNFLPHAIFYLKGCSYFKPCWKKMSNQTSKVNIVSALIQSTFCYMRVEIKILSSFFPTYVFYIYPSMFDRIIYRRKYSICGKLFAIIIFKGSRSRAKYTRKVVPRFLLVFLSSLSDTTGLRGLHWRWFSIVNWQCVDKIDCRSNLVN